MRIFYIDCDNGELRVVFRRETFTIPAFIDLNSRYARERIKEGRKDIIGCYHLEESTSKKMFFDFTDQVFYKLGKQLSKR